MRAVYYFVSALLLAPVCNAQTKANGIRFISNDWGLARSTALSEDKLVFIDVYTTWCTPCKQMDKYVFSTDEVGNHFNDSFVNLKINAESAIGKPIAQQYGIRSYPTYIFATPEGDVVHKIKGAMTPAQLLGEATEARRLARNYRPLTELETAYARGERSPRFLYEYLRQKSAADGRQPEVLETYMEHLPKAEQRTENVLSLISKNLESIDSKGFTVLKNALDDFDQLSERQQVAVISGIAIAKKLTFKTVIDTKDDELFELLIESVYATAYSRTGALAEENQFRFDYATITRNFAAYKKLSDRKGDMLLSKTKEVLAEETQTVIANFLREAQRQKLAPSSQPYQQTLKDLSYGAEKAASFQLNELAWGYVMMATLPGDLERAMRWADRSLELYIAPANLTTKAHLLYRLGERKKAMKFAKKAIKMGRRVRSDVSTLKTARKRMKKRLPVIINPE